MYLLHFIFVPRLFIKSTNCIGSCVRFEHLFWVGLLRGEMWSNLAELNKISFGCNNSFNPCPFSSTYGSWLPRSWVLQPLSPCVGASLEEHELDQWQSSTQTRSNVHHQHTIPPSTLTSRSANKESACLSRETSWRIAWHRLWLLTQSRGSSPGGGGTLPRQAGWRGRVGNGILLQTTWNAKLNKSKVSAARAACRHCRGAIGESSRSCRAPRYISTISTSLLVFSTSLQHVSSTHVEK